MARKLKNLRLTSVDLVRSGANQEADICLYKSADTPPEIPSENDAGPVRALFDKFMDWMSGQVEKGAEKGAEEPTDIPSEDPAPENPPVEKKAPDYDYIVEISEVEKFNPYHDRLGRFASSNGFMNSGYSGDPNKKAVTFSANPKTRAGAMAIARASDGDTGHELIGSAYGKNPGESMAVPPKEPKKPKESAGGFGNQETQDGHLKTADGKDLSHLYGKQAQDHIEGYVKCTSEQAEAYANGISSFTGSGYSNIRDAQVNPDKYLSSPLSYKKAAVQKGNDIEEYIEKAPKWGNSGTIYRGIDVDVGTQKKILESALRGDTLDQLGTSSWSTDRKVSESFAGHDPSTSLLFRCEGGTMKGTSIQHLSGFYSEHEVLISKTARWKATNVAQENGYWVIDVAELP